MENLISLVNKLQRACTALGNHGEESALPTLWDSLPAIAVVVGQSSGKSSVLESVVGKDFLPQGSGIVTRRPLVLQLHRINGDREYSEFMHNPMVKYTDFALVRKEIADETERATGHTKQISPVLIYFSIYAPNANAMLAIFVNLTLIDLPGLTKVAVEGQSGSIVQDIETMPNCIILAISRANQDLATSDAIKISREVDPKGAGAVEFILCHAELLKTFPNATKYLKTIVSFGKVNPEQKENVEQNGVSIYSWEEFLLLGGEEKYELPTKEKDDICTIMYTSGTTGDPKGVLISNRSIITIDSAVDEFLENSNEQLREDDVYISYLPLAHIFDHVLEEVFIHHGASIGFWRGDVKLLVEDIGELKPTVFCAVPRVLDRIYGGLQYKVSTGGFLKKTLMLLTNRNMMKGSKHEEAAAIFDKLVFTKVQRGLGGRVPLILSGAAPLSNHVEGFLRVITCSLVLQGYGLTETCAGSFVSLPNDMSMLGTVGPPVPYVEVRLESVPEMGYDALSKESPRGEICIRGDTLFSGYYKREDLTKEVLVDGWFHTGDIGEWQPDGSMKIIDRKKNIFKLSQGEYVAVKNLENIFGLAPGVDSIRVYGNSFESCLVAVASPNKQALERWAKSNVVTGDFASICEDPKAKELILGELTKTGKEKKLKALSSSRLFIWSRCQSIWIVTLLTQRTRRSGHRSSNITRQKTLEGVYKCFVASCNLRAPSTAWIRT